MSIFVCPLCSQNIDTDFEAELVHVNSKGQDSCCMDCFEAWYNETVVSLYPRYSEYPPASPPPITPRKDI